MIFRSHFVFISDEIKLCNCWAIWLWNYTFLSLFSPNIPICGVFFDPNLSNFINSSSPSHIYPVSYSSTLHNTMCRAGHLNPNCATSLKNIFWHLIHSLKFVQADIIAHGHPKEYSHQTNWTACCFTLYPLKTIQA